MFCACRCFSYKLLPFVFFSQGVLFTISLVKYFFRKTEAVSWSCFVLSISQNLLENTWFGVHSFSEVAGHRPATLLKRDSGTGVFSWVLPKKSRKSSISDVRLGSKYVLASGRYWWEKLIVEEKLKKSLFNSDLNRGCLVYMFSLRFSESKFLINLRRQFRVR